nr:hypothetical protein Iba_chr07eCG0500 [Ipomoea batatas]
MVSSSCFSSDASATSETFCRMTLTALTQEESKLQVEESWRMYALIQSDATRGAVVRPYVTTFARTSLGGKLSGSGSVLLPVLTCPSPLLPADAVLESPLAEMIEPDCHNRENQDDRRRSGNFFRVYQPHQQNLGGYQPNDDPTMHIWPKRCSALLLQEREDLLNAINAREGLNEGNGDHKEEAQTAAPHRDENETNAAGTIAFGSFRTLSLSASSYMNLSSIIAAKTQILTHSQRE